MKLFQTKSTQPEFNTENYIPVIRCSICTGEKTAGFKDKNTGLIKEVMLIKSDRDLQAFRDRYHITGKIEKVY
ncbi:MAG: aspartate dehydrogenase [Clostridia bacterium]|nr:aspartate dehydrogenase [Clostridia bacterium]